MIHASGLAKDFSGFLAVRDVNLDVPQGEVLVLLGPNGAGKTTTIRMLSSVLRPTSGSASVAGFDVVHEALQVRRSVGVLTEQHGLYHRMNAQDYLHFFADVYQMDRRTYPARVRTLLEQFGLGAAGKKRLGEFSKGMRQKLALIRALLHDPPVLLLDEPTSAMDPESARMVRDSIRGLRSGDRTILLCTHNLAEAEELADQIAIILNGGILIDGTPDGLKARLLGPDEYQVRISGNGTLQPADLAGFEVMGIEPDSIRFRTSNPETENPRLIRALFGLGVEVIWLQKIPHSLESAYLLAIQQGKEAA